MRKIFGILLIIFSLFIALGGLLTLEEDFKASLFGILVISLPLYMIGHIVRTNMWQAKQKGLRWLWAYIYVVGIIPALFLSYEGYENLKEQTFSNNHFLLFESTATDYTGGLSIGFILLLLLLFIFPFYETTRKIKSMIAIAAVVVTGVYAGYQYMMWADYRGIHEVDGLVTHYWNGEEQIVPYEEIAQIAVQPYVKYARSNRPSDKTYFAWRLIFMTKNEEQITYRLWLNDISLSKGNRIKQLAHSKNIPFHVIPMTEKQREEFDFQLELKKLDWQPYYLFFEVE
ncbi:hypothetical protein MHZ95_17480 [Sporosarcina sp. ACRSM]|uniref:hypothetical protein n=1 Tax=Sporosarcina sp. ACRSM TaxID=2918216 RepID=UPI001EF6CBE4|nr:hypothetical protein [Sporosarcina sp. ACRSM]MCG7337054.1 hypothetical protein [Sporosarcina sp. ACRSM]